MAKQAAMTPRQAAEKLGLGIHRLYELIWEAKLTAHRVDGRWRIPAAAVDARLKQRWEREMLPNKPRRRHPDGRPYRHRRNRKPGEPDVDTPADVSADPITLADLGKGR